MSTGNIARRLIELCRAGQFDRALDELYAKDARSIELDGADQSPLSSVKGLDAIRAKGKQFEAKLEKIHSIAVSDPLIADPFFTIAMRFDATYKDGGRKAMNEVCLYEVRNHKIVREQFFYEAG